MTPIPHFTDAQCRAELARILGYGLIAERGCMLTELPFGDATVIVEYERDGDDIAIAGVLINGCMCDAEDVVPAHTLERWREELREENEDDGDADRWYEQRRDERMEE